MSTAEKILSQRKRKGISQEELANELNVSRQAVSKWESNQSIPDMEKIILLSNYFGVTTDYLLKNDIEFTEHNDNKYGSNVESQALKNEVSEEEYQYIINEAEKKKHISYWLIIIAPVAVLLAVLIYYYCFYH